MLMRALCDKTQKLRSQSYSARRAKPNLKRVLSPSTSRFKIEADLTIPRIQRQPTTSKLVPDQISPWLQEKKRILEPLNHFAEREKKISKSRLARRKIHIKDYINEYPLEKPKTPDKVVMTPKEKNIQPSLIENKKDPDTKGVPHFPKRSPKRPTDAKLERVFQRYRKLIKEQDEVAVGQAFSPGRGAKFNEKYIQRPKNWMFRMENQNSSLANASIHSARYHRDDESDRSTPFSDGGGSESRGLSILGSKMRLKKGIYSVNLEGFLTPSSGKSAGSSFGGVVGNQSMITRSTALRSPLRSNELSPGARSARSKRNSDYLGSPRAANRVQDYQTDSVSSRPLLCTDDLKQKHYPFNSEKRSQEIWTSTDDSVCSDEPPRCPKTQRMASLFKPAFPEEAESDRLSELRPSLLGSKDMATSMNILSAAGQSKSRQRQASSTSFSRKSRGGVKPEGSLGGGGGASKKHSGSGNISTICLSKFDKKHTKLLASFNRNLREKIQSGYV